MSRSKTGLTDTIQHGKRFLVLRLGNNQQFEPIIKLQYFTQFG